MKKSLAQVISFGIAAFASVVGCGEADLDGAAADSEQNAAAVTGVACSVTYSAAQDWSTGFTGAVEITNQTGAPLSDWALAFSFPGNQRITSSWNATLTQSGASV